MVLTVLLHKQTNPNIFLLQLEYLLVFYNNRLLLSRLQKANVKLGLFFLQMTFAEQLNVKALRTSD